VNPPLAKKRKRSAFGARTLWIDEERGLFVLRSTQR
jgi:hypothetical protein